MNQLKVTQDMVDNAKDRKGIGLLAIDPYRFLSLTCPSSSVHQWLNEEKDTTQSLDQYNEWATQNKIRVMPFLKIDIVTGKVISHEGRHRAAALYAAHGNEMWIAVFLARQGYTEDRDPKDRSRYYGADDIPEFLKAEFHGGTYAVNRKSFKPFTKQKIVATNTPKWIPRSKHAMSVGALIYAADTGKFLLGKRSATVEDPNVWGTFGGGVDPGESVEAALRRELKEEAGYTGDLSIQPLYTYKRFDNTQGFRYFNNLGVVPKQFIPSLNFETSEARWFDWGDHPTPLHPGVQTLFDDPASRIVIESVSGPWSPKGVPGKT